MMGARTCWNNRKRRGGRGSKTYSRGVDPKYDKKYLSEDLSRWIKTKKSSSRKRRWEEGKNAMKERKKNTG
jgi:hypothetical protein